MKKLLSLTVFLTLLASSPIVYAESLIIFNDAEGEAPIDIYVNLNKSNEIVCRSNADCEASQLCVKNMRDRGVCLKQTQWGFDDASSINPFESKGQSGIQFYRMKKSKVNAKGEKTDFYYFITPTGPQIYVKKEFPDKNAAGDTRSVFVSIKDGKTSSIFDGYGDAELHFIRLIPFASPTTTDNPLSVQGTAIDGSYKEYYENGKIKILATIVNGTPDGIYQEFYANGKVKKIENWKNGRREGPSKTYYESGQLQSEFNNKNDNQDGITKLFNEDGSPFAQFFVKDGKIEE